MKNKSEFEERGTILLIACALLLFVSILMATMFNLFISNNETQMEQRFANEAFCISESGARYAFAKIYDGDMKFINSMEETMVLSNGSKFTVSTYRHKNTIYLVSIGYARNASSRNTYEIPYENGHIMASSTGREHANENSAIRREMIWQDIRIRDYWIGCGAIPQL